MLTWLASPFMFALGLIIVTWQALAGIVLRLSGMRRH
jgi:hypothetical protein